GKRADQGMRSSIDGSDRKLIHPLLTDSSAALADDTPLRIVVYEWRYLPFESRLLVMKSRSYAVLTEAVGLVLKLALAGPVAHRAIDRMIREKKLDHCRTCLFNLLRLRAHDHSFGDRHSACSLELRNLLDPDNAHSTRGLGGEPAKVAEPRKEDAIHL